MEGQAAVKRNAVAYTMKGNMQKTIDKCILVHILCIDSNKIVYGSVEASSCFRTQLFVELNRGLCVTST